MPSNNIPLNGWPQIKNLEKVTPILSELDKIETWQKSVKQETKSGAYVEYNNALALNAVAVSADITATQDLHGYDKPWVGGAGKNKFAPLNYTTITSDSITYPELQSGGSLSDNITLPAGDYVLSLTLKSKPSTDRSLYLYPTGSSADLGYIAHLNQLTVNQRYTKSFNLASETSIYARLWGSGGGSFECQLQIESGTTATSYEPYENICPITGFSSVTITDVDSESHTATVTVSLGQTVYGGTLDLTSGELTVSNKYVDLSSLSNWTYDTVNKRWSKYIDDLYDYTSRSANIICEKYATDTTATAGDEGKVFTINKYILVVTTDSTNAPTGGCVYPLATPTTTTLTAAEVALVAGYNKIESDTGNIEVSAYTGDTWN